VLAGGALLLAFPLGVLMGVLSAARPGSRIDQLSQVVAMVGVSMPAFWVGLLLIIGFSVRLGWLPGTGMYAPVGDGGLRDLLTHLILPAITLSLVPLAISLASHPHSMLDVIAQDYVRTARAKGASEPRVIGWHAFRNTLVPLVTVLGLEVATCWLGAVYVETVFSWPGIGFMMVNAILTRDFPLVQGGVLLIASHLRADQSRDRSALRVRGPARASCLARRRRRPGGAGGGAWPGPRRDRDRHGGGAGALLPLPGSQPTQPSRRLAAPLTPGHPLGSIISAAICWPRDLGRARVADGGDAGHAAGDARGHRHRARHRVLRWPDRQHRHARHRPRHGLPVHPARDAARRRAGSRAGERDDRGGAGQRPPSTRAACAPRCSCCASKNSWRRRAPSAPPEGRILRRHVLPGIVGS
jgi:hypothetical protein